MARGNPEEILRQIKSAEQMNSKNARGRLKIFFGYAAGVGKTYAMLEAAHEAKRAGIDVVCGYIEPHQRPATTALLSGLEILPLKKGTYHGITLSELDVDKVLERRPQLVLVDELADSSVELLVRIWTDPEEYWDERWEMTEQIKLALDAAGIEIAFPQLDVHVR